MHAQYVTMRVSLLGGEDTPYPRSSFFFFCSIKVTSRPKTNLNGARETDVTPTTKKGPKQSCTKLSSVSVKANGSLHHISTFYNMDDLAIT